MGWKSTIDISREEAKKLIINQLFTMNELSNEDIERLLEACGYGDNDELEYFGHNFNVVDDK